MSTPELTSSDFLQIPEKNRIEIERGHLCPLRHQRVKRKRHVYEKNL